MKAIVGDQQLEVFINDDGEARFNEYQEVTKQPVRQRDRPVTSCFLEREDDKSFTVVVGLREQEGRQPRRNCDWEAKLYIHGQHVETRVWGAPDTDVMFSSLVHESEGSVMESKLQFAKQATTDVSEQVTVDLVNAKEAGQIRIDIAPGKMGKQVAGAAALVKERITAGVANEEQAKLLASTVTHGETDLYRDEPVYSFTPYPPRKSRQSQRHRFIFNYRTRPVLQSMDIIKQEDMSDVVIVDNPAGGKRKRTGSSASQGQEPGVTAAEMSSMKRELEQLRAQVRRLNQAASRNPARQAIDLTGSDDDE